MKLFGTAQCNRVGQPILGRITEQPNTGSSILLLGPEGQGADGASGYAATLRVGGPPVAAHNTPSLAARVAPDFAYLQEGDIVRIHPDAGRINVLYRRSSRYNSLLVTERCNSNCLMCSQPPKDVDDRFLVDELLQIIPLMDPATPELGITGGEPTLLGPLLNGLIVAIRDTLPTTALHMLTNGRSFCDVNRANELAELGHPDFMLGIPLYSDLPWRHDFVVQAAGAFDETVRGLMHLGAAGVRIELRVVIHLQTYERLPGLAEFIARNLPFVDQVAFMGLELTGHTPMNLDALWIDPVDYQRELVTAVRALEHAGPRVLIFNHPLCVLPEELWPFARQSISDWKNAFVEVCTKCSVQDRCGGFFESGMRRLSRGVTPVASNTALS